jgi:hypothetical protein
MSVATRGLQPDLKIFTASNDLASLYVKTKFGTSSGTACKAVSPEAKPGSETVPGTVFERESLGGAEQSARTDQNRTRYGFSSAG